MRTILHVDMDAFFASVEYLHHPEWRGKPLIVGAGPHERGVVSTCSYEARKYGVHSAMPSRTAYQLCPHAVFVEPHMDLYQAVSRQVFQVFERFTPYVEGVSIDEAFLDITGSIHLYGSAAQLGEALRHAVHETCGVTCSIGIAPNRLLAKLGSEVNKPNGLFLMPTEPAATTAFLAPKPLRILWGVGKKLAEALQPYGITTCHDIQKLAGAPTTPPPFLVNLLGDALATSLTQAAFGLSDDTVQWEDVAEKSVSREHTFETDESNRARVRQVYLALVSAVGQRFRREKRWARTARIKLRDATFQTLTRQIAFLEPSCDDIAFRAAALQLFDLVWPKGKRLTVRLIGFGVTNIQTTPDNEDNLLLFSDDKEAARQKRERLSSALDALREKGLIVSPSPSSPDSES